MNKNKLSTLVRAEYKSLVQDKTSDYRASRLVGPAAMAMVKHQSKHSPRWSSASVTTAKIKVMLNLIYILSEDIWTILCQSVQ